MFPEQFKSAEWQEKIHEIVPSYGQTLNGNVALTQKVWNDTAAALQLTTPPVIPGNTEAEAKPAAPEQAAPEKAAEKPQADIAL